MFRVPTIAVRPRNAELRIVAFDRETTFPLTSQSLSVGSGLDCDLAVAGLQPGVAFRLTMADDGSIVLASERHALLLTAPESRTVEPSETLVLRSSARWAVGDAVFHLNVPEPSIEDRLTLGANTLRSRLAPIRVPLGLGAIAVGLLVLVTGAREPQSALAIVSPPSPWVDDRLVEDRVVEDRGGASTQDGVLSELRRSLIEAGVASRVSIANTASGLVYDIQGSDQERSHIESLIETAKQSTAVPIVRRPSDLEPLRKKVAALIQRPIPRLLMTDGRSVRLGETVHMDWTLEAVGAGSFVLARDSERTTIALSEGGTR